VSKVSSSSFWRALQLIRGVGRALSRSACAKSLPIQAVRACALVVSVVACSCAPHHGGSSESATVGLLKAANALLESYRLTCGGYPRALRASLVPSPPGHACRYTATIGDPNLEDLLLRAADGKVALSYVWLYSPSACAAASGMCSTYSLEARFYGSTGPLDSWRRFTMTPARLQWVSRGRFGFTEAGGYDW
jgi:hypothetical protein